MPTQDSQNNLKLLDGFKIFSGLNDDEKNSLIKLETVVVRYFDGNFLIKQGDSDIRLFILLAGNVNVVKEEDTSKVLAQLKRGDLFGEVSFISLRPRTANVITVGQVIVIRMAGDQLHTLPHVIQNKIQEQLVDLLVKRLDNMNKNILPFLRFSQCHP